MSTPEKDICDDCIAHKGQICDTDPTRPACANFRKLLEQYFTTNKQSVQCKYFGREECGSKTPCITFKGDCLHN